MLIPFTPLYNNILPRKVFQYPSQYHSNKYVRPKERMMARRPGVLVLGALAIVVALVVVIVTWSVASPRVTHANPSLDNMLRSASARIREELKQIPPTLITSKGRRAADWGDKFPKELMALHQQKTGWIQAWSAQHGVANSDWLNFGLVIQGKNIGLNCELCPFTMSVLSRIKGLITAGFSCLRPGAVIGKHTDYLKDTNESVHLGLISRQAHVLSG
jgi:Aspartyl/asparaginyl beta-hydroxylase and related dioxygenases